MPRVYNLRELNKISEDQLDTIVPISADDMLTIEDKRVRLTYLSKAATLANANSSVTGVVLNTTTGLVALYAKLIHIDNQIVFTEKGYGIPIECIYSLDVVIGK